jgi:hypothetical protein
MISIGAIYNGPELKDSRINRALRATSKSVDALRGPLKLGDTPVVNAVFVVAGSFGPPGFDCPEYGKFSARDKAVVVQLPVPRSVLEGNDYTTFIVDSLRGANAMAFHFFEERGEKFPLREAEALVTSVGDHLGAEAAKWARS